MGSNLSTSLRQAIIDKDLELVRQLLGTEGIDINVKDNFGRTPLHYASKYGHLEIVNALITAGADVNTKDNDGWIPLRLASIKGYSEIVEILKQAEDHQNPIKEPDI